MEKRVLKPFTVKTNKMHLFQINTLIYYVFYMFKTRGFIFRKTVAHLGMV